MFQATTTSTDANTGIGIFAASGASSSMHSSTKSAWIMPATGVRPPDLTLAAVRAMAPVAGMPPKQIDAMLPDALRAQLDVAAVPPADHAVGDHAAEQALDGRQHGDGRAPRGSASRTLLELMPFSQPKLGAGSVRGMPPNLLPIVSTPCALRG